ncbi:MICAL-like protein 2 [Coregonus clupeaformis]|uniref:MICAL-like protein 2 n=1 Tax=Coregonus clupeaformis TaxID=59861 RepID=UPI001BE092A1|nr:MICAL-like protein 2 [Coregonus clupeaformis]
MAAIKALQQWCKLQCNGYRDVAIINMTTSFRDGLAFCALIHKYRPDLIDYDSLNKEDVFDNNNLAFRVAEDKLGIAALLDAEDMVALRIPDRLSVLTYVSQYYNYFHGRNPIGGVGAVKRPAEGSKEELSGKKNLPVVAKTIVSKTAIENRPPCSSLMVKTSPKSTRAAVQKTEVLVESSNKTGTLSSKCVVCKCHVHLVQRHFIEGKLYHRSCFKCSECSNVLLAGAYKPGKEPGSFICNDHQNTKNGCNKPPSSGAVIQTGSPSANVESKSDTSRVQSVSRPTSVPSTPVKVVLKPVETTTTTTPAPQPWTSSARRTQAARHKFFQSSTSAPEGPPSSHKPPAPSGLPRVPLSTEEEKNRARAVITKKLVEANCNNNNTRYFVIRPAERRFGDLPSSADLPSWKQANCGPGTAGQQAAQPFTSNKELLNTVKKASAGPTTVSSTTKGRLFQFHLIWRTYRAEAPVNWRSKLKPVKNGPGLKFCLNLLYVQSKMVDFRESPIFSCSLHAPSFSSTSDSEDRAIVVEQPKPEAISKSFSTSIIVNISSTSPRTPPAAFNPLPPGPLSHRAPSPRQPRRGSGGLGTRNLNYSTTLSSTPPLVPVWHRVPTSSQPHHSSAGSGSKNGSYSPPMSPKQPHQGSTGSKNGKYLSPTNTSRSEMRLPLCKSHHIPMDQIVKELREIDDCLGDLERKGVEMEKRLRSCEEEGEGDILMDPLMVDWFNLIRKKQTCIRRESELVYIAKTQDLEEQQPGVEGELRRLLEKPDHLKSTSERRREDRLMERLMEIVNGRNAIVEGLDEDRLREDEEDQQLNEMMQTLGLKKSKIKRKSSFKMLFRRKSSKKVTVSDQGTVL